MGGNNNKTIRVICTTVKLKKCFSICCFQIRLLRIINSASSCGVLGSLLAIFLICQVVLMIARSDESAACIDSDIPRMCRGLSLDVFVAYLVIEITMPQFDLLSLRRYVENQCDFLLFYYKQFGHDFSFTSCSIPHIYNIMFVHPILSYCCTFYTKVKYTNYVFVIKIYVY